MDAEISAENAKSFNINLLVITIKKTIFKYFIFFH